MSDDFFDCQIFFDRQIQETPSNRSILRLLQGLSETTWQPIAQPTDADKTAISVLVLANGIETRGTWWDDLEARLMESGVFWQGVLRASPDNDRATIKARGAVLKFIWDAREERNSNWTSLRLDAPKSEGESEPVPQENPAGELSESGASAQAKMKRLRPGEAASKILAALHSLAECGKWNAAESEIARLSGVSKSTYYANLTNDDAVKLAMKKYRACRLGRGPDRKNDY
jgi:hypothetical protein